MPDLTIKLGDFQVITLDRQNSFDPNPIHMAYIRYNGTIPQGNQSVLAFEIGRYDGNKDVQEGSPYYLPVTEKIIDCRVDTYGRRVKLKIIEASSLEIKARDLTERQSAVRD